MSDYTNTPPERLVALLLGTLKANGEAIGVSQYTYETHPVYWYEWGSPMRRVYCHPIPCTIKVKMGCQWYAVTVAEADAP